MLLKSSKAKRIGSGEVSSAGEGNLVAWEYCQQLHSPSVEQPSPGGYWCATFPLICSLNWEVVFPKSKAWGKISYECTRSKKNSCSCAYCVF